MSSQLDRQSAASRADNSISPAVKHNCTTPRTQLLCNSIFPFPAHQPAATEGNDFYQSGPLDTQCQNSVTFPRDYLFLLHIGLSMQPGRQASTFNQSEAGNRRGAGLRRRRRETDGPGLGDEREEKPGYDVSLTTAVWRRRGSQTRAESRSQLVSQARNNHQQDGRIVILQYQNCFSSVVRPEWLSNAIQRGSLTDRAPALCRLSVCLSILFTLRQPAEQSIVPVPTSMLGDKQTRCCYGNCFSLLRYLTGNVEQFRSQFVFLFGTLEAAALIQKSSSISTIYAINWQKFYLMFYIILRVRTHILSNVATNILLSSLLRLKMQLNMLGTF